MKSNNKFSM